MKRADFIRNTGAFFIPLLAGGMKLKAFMPLHLPSESDNENILVLVQLFGGNDGLNTIVPLDIYRNYFNARKGLALQEKDLLHLQGYEQVGLHPSLSHFKELFQEHQLSIIQSVGYPVPDFSHFRSTDIWMAGAVDERSLTNGWIGRLLQQRYQQYPSGYPNLMNPDPLAVQLGTTPSLVFQGTRTPMAINISNGENIFQSTAGLTESTGSLFGQKRLDHVLSTARQTQQYTTVISKAMKMAGRQLEYPERNSLARQLKTVAALISGGLRTRIYLVSYDGFDTHAQQVTAADSSRGRHADLLADVDQAIGVFQKDLRQLKIDHKVLGMTFSEFGRRIVANDSLGTDHGTAAPMFLFGSKLRGGIIGKNPSIPDQATKEDNIEMQFDFRNIYHTVLEKWMGADSSEINSILYPGSSPINGIF